MTHDKSDRFEHELEALFAKIRAEATEAPADDLISRVLADAGHAQARFTAPETVPEAPGLLGQFVDMLGGWPVLGGLATAGIAGLWIGIAPPAALDQTIAGFFGTMENTLDFDPLEGFGLDLMEG